MQPKIIEITGPPGVGKSTIYQSLCRTWKPASPWVYPDVVFTAKPPFRATRKWMMYQLRMLLGKKLTKSIPVDYGLRFASRQHELAQFCWDVLSDTGSDDAQQIAKRFRSAYFLFTTFCRYQAITEKNLSKPCVIEEGLLQKSFFIYDDEQRTLELLEKYISLIPLPYAIVYINTPDIPEIVSRLRGRNKIIASHLHKDDAALERDIQKWQHAFDEMLGRLQRAGVAIIRINARQPVKENISQIITILEQVAGQHLKTQPVTSAEIATVG
jgi:hypothetical protein